MADRTVKVRLEADISDFITDIGVKAPAAVRRLQDSATKASATLKKTGADGAAIGDGVASGTSKATAQVKKLAADTEKTVAATGEKVKKTFEKTGNDSGKSFGAGFKKWLTGSGADMGKAGGSVFGSGFLGALKTPILGPAIVAILTGLVLTTLPAVGAVAGGAFVTGFGGGLAGLGLVFAAQNEHVKQVWANTLGQLASDLRLLSQPFESTLTNIADYFQRTVDGFNPVLAKVFPQMSKSVDSFVNNTGRAFEELIPAIEPVSDAFNKVLEDLGRGGAIKDLIQDISAGLTDLADSVAANPQALGDFVRGLGDVLRSALELVTTLNEVNTSFEQLTGGVSLVDVTMKGLQSTLAPLILLFDQVNSGIGILNALTHDTDASGASMSAAAANTVNLANSIDKTAAAAQHGAAPARTLEERIAANAKKAADAKKAFDDFMESMFRFQNLALGLSGAQINFQAALDSATQSIKDNGKTLNKNTEAGRANQSALNEVARSANAQTEALGQSARASGQLTDEMVRAGQGTAAMATSAEKSRANFIKLAMQMGLTRPQAEAMAKSMISIPNVSRTAKLTANKKDLETKLAAAKKELGDKDLTKERKAELKAEIKKLEAGIARAKTLLGQVPSSKNVSITTTFTEIHRVVGAGSRSSSTGVGGGHEVQGRGQADGGYYPHGVPSYANGKLPDQAMIAPGRGRGLVQWAEGETGGEAFIPLAPSKRDRSEMILGKVADSFGLGLVRSFASGGFLPGGNLVDVAFLLRQLGLPFAPTAGINYSGSLAALNRANSLVAPSKTAATRANAAETAAKAQVARIQRAITLQQRYITAIRAGKPGTKSGQAAEDRKVKQETKELIGLQDQLYRAKLKVTAATKTSNAADATYKTRADAAAKAAAAYKDAVEKLVEQQKAAVDFADQVATGLTGGANIGDLFAKSLTGKGLLADLQGQGAALKQFGALITQLRAKRLDEDLIQQIIGKGAGQGTDIASAILGGGAALVASLNAAQKALEDQANLIGAGSAVAQYGVKVAGARAGGGSVDAGMTYRVNEKGQEFFTAPIDGHVVPAGVDPRRYIQGLAGSGWGGSSSATREVHVHQNNYFTGVSMAEADLIASRANAKVELAARGY